MSIPKDNVIGNLKSRYQWKKIERPRAWRPKTVGEELVGYYGGKTARTGQFGQYEVVLVHVPTVGSFLISGVEVIQGFDSAAINVGWPVRVVWQGLQELDKDKEDGKPEAGKRTMKRFDVFVAEGEPVPAEFLPRLADEAPTGPQ